MIAAGGPAGNTRFVRAGAGTARPAESVTVAARAARGHLAAAKDALNRPAPKAGAECDTAAAEAAAYARKRKAAP